jgi:hypothetical protein
MSRKKSKIEKIKKKKKMYSLNLSVSELAHIRDMMSVLIPKSGLSRLSEVVADSQGRLVSEEKLWKKVAIACKDAKIEIGENAPEYFLGISHLQLNIEKLPQDFAKTNVGDDE